MRPADDALLILGAGQAGAELAFAARQQGWTGPVVLLGDEGELPYQRPPLSKVYLAGAVGGEALTLRSAEAFDKAGIETRMRSAVTALDLAGRRVVLDDGDSLGYRKLAICTGGRARPLTCVGLPGKTPANLHYLRHKRDADRLREALVPGKRLAIVGGGYVGLEVAASARKRDVEVTLIETQSRVLSRVTGERLSSFYEGVHRAAGVDVRTSTSIARVVCDDDERITSLSLTGAERLDVDVVVAGVGMQPNIEFAEAAGLSVDGGIVVDAHSQTSDPDVVAAGDCTAHYSSLYRRVVRLESVPNALEQARAAAATSCGKAKPNASIPWFWSDQYDLKLQMVGLSQGFESIVIRGDPDTRSFIAFYLRASRLIAADAVNRPADFMMAKKMIGRLAASETALSAALADASLPLKDVASGLLVDEPSPPRV